MAGHNPIEFLFSNIMYSCVTERMRGHEQFVSEHALAYMIDGSTHIQAAGYNQVFGEGTIAFVKRNQLLKATKIPPADGIFKSINIFLTQDILRQYSAKHHIVANSSLKDSFRIVVDPFIKGYFDSLLPYFDSSSKLSESLIEIKTQEAIELLLRYDPNFKNILFDFSEPHKIDLEAFMLQNYMFNVPMERFAKLTGRSLAGFKRDFETIFQQSPGRWLQEKRLAEAYYQIKEQHKKPSEVYLEIGFENLSHFSFVFKKRYGVGPSLVH